MERCPGQAHFHLPSTPRGRGGRSAAETVSAVTEASLMWTQEVPAPTSQPAVQAGKAIWVRKCVF